MVRRRGATVGFFATRVEDDALYVETMPDQSDARVLELVVRAPAA